MDIHSIDQSWVGNSVGSIGLSWRQSGYEPSFWRAQISGVHYFSNSEAEKKVDNTTKLNIVWFKKEFCFGTTFSFIRE